MRVPRFTFLIAAAFALFTVLLAAGAAHAQTATTTALQQSSACLTSGCVTTLTASVTVTATQKAAPLGIVYICQGTATTCENQVPLGVFQLPATGPLTVKVQLSAGAHTLYAVYRGTKTYARSKSVPQTVTIAPAAAGSIQPTVTTISASGSSDGYNLSSAVSALTTPATGSVSFLDTSNHNTLVATAPLIAGTPSAIYANGGLDFSQVSANSLAGASSAISGDFNNDGYQDILVGGVLLLGNGKGGFTPGPVPAGVPAPAPTTVDFNNDGIPDKANIGFLRPTGDAVFIYLGYAGGGFATASQSPLYAFEDDLDSLFLADFRNNGNQDVAFRDSYGVNFVLYPGNGDGTFATAVYSGIPGNGAAYLASDFDGDGILDVLVVGSGNYFFTGSGGSFTYGTTITLYHGNGDLTFTARPTQTIVPTGDSLAGVTTGDFNGDGILDVLATFNTPGGTQILQPLFYDAQKTAFDPGPSIQLPVGNFYTYGDFNGDGQADFVTFGPYPITGYTYEAVVPASATTGPGIVLPGSATHNVVASYPGDSLHSASVSTAIPLAGSATAFPGGIAGLPGITLNGSASLQGNSIVLTDGKQFEAGSFFSSNRVSVSGFTTGFDFQLTNAAADGFAFVVQNNGPDAIGSGGGGLGYANEPPALSGPGIINSVAVAFDLHNNLGEGDNSVYLEYNGGTGAYQVNDLTPSGINLHSGHHFHADIVYMRSFNSSMTGSIEVTVTDLDTKAVFQKVLPTGNSLSFLNDYVNGSTAYVGFTGGTGVGTAVQTISNWTFTPTSAPLLYPSPSFPTGFGSSSGLHFNGGAAISGNAIDLTYGTHFEAPSVYYTSQVGSTGQSLGFYTDFDFQVENGIGDGFTFVVQDQGLNAQGSSGGGLGYGPDRPKGAGAYIPKSFAVKFDLHNNAGEGVNSTGVYVNGASPTIPATDLTPSGIDLNNGHVFHAHIMFSGNTVNLAITDLTKYRVFNQSYYIPSQLPSLGYAGFTAGTGATTSSIKILNWTWTEQ